MDFSTHFNHNSSIYRAFLVDFVTFKCLFIFFTITILPKGNSQLETLKPTINRWIEDFIENQENNNNFEFWELQESIYEHLNNPIHINDISYSFLSELYLFDEYEIQSILSHMDKYGPFIDIYEVQAIKGVSMEKAKLLSQFVYIDQDRIIPLSLIEERGTLFIKWKKDFETRKGFKDLGNGPNFKGDENYLFLRYKQKVGYNWQYGLTLEKDPGEDFKNSIFGFDYISGYIRKDNLTNRIKTIIVGDFSARFGQGLIVGNSFNLGKSVTTINTNVGGEPIRPYTSTQENLFYRGIATEIRTSFNTNLYTFISHKAIDANLMRNGNNELIASSLPTAGLHRTSSEIDDRDANYETTVGTKLSYRTNSTQISLNASSTHYPIPLMRSNQDYNRFRFSGNTLYNASLDYRMFSGVITSYGEIAISNNSAIAHTHSLLASLHPKLDITINYRSFDKSFYSIATNSFSETGGTQNEKGIYFGFAYRPHQNWKINSYIDLWEHPWLRFRVDAPSTGYEYAFRTEFIQKKKRNIYIQYRYEKKQENTSEPTISDFLVNRSTHKVRIQYSENILSSLKLRTRVEFVRHQKEVDRNNGWLIYQDIIYRSLTVPVDLTARISYFNIDDFDARIYAFENDISYEYSIPFYNGVGYRYYVVSRYKYSKSLNFEIKLAQTKYIDGREIINSGNNEIVGNKNSQVKLQLRYSF